MSRFAFWVAMGVFKVGILACLIALALIARSRAHDGYPAECCDQRHCKPIAAPAREGAYWVLPDKRRFLAGTTRNSSEIGKTGFHLCDWNATDYVPQSYEQSTIVQPKGKPVCLFVPGAEH